jgi:hypothetical protein
VAYNAMTWGRSFSLRFCSCSALSRPCRSALRIIQTSHKEVQMWLSTCLSQRSLAGLRGWIYVGIGANVDLLDLKPSVAESPFENVLPSDFVLGVDEGYEFGLTVCH